MTRWITALYPARCRKCWRDILRGDTVLYWKADRVAWCKGCGSQEGK